MFGGLFKKKDAQRPSSAVSKQRDQPISSTDAADLKEKVASLTEQIKRTTDDKEKRHLLYNPRRCTSKIRERFGGHCCV